MGWMRTPEDDRTEMEPAPVKADPQQLSDREKTLMDAAFVTWRFHLWGKNYGTYTDIENKVASGELKPFLCPDPDCGCTWRKPEGGANAEA